MVREVVRKLAAEAWVREALEEVRALEALDEALAARGLTRLPSDPGSLARFFDGPLLQSLIGRVHPVTAQAVVDELRERLAREVEKAAGPSGQAATVPPPALAADESYDDLASGVIHTRATPAWGLRRGDVEAPASTSWLIVSTDAGLVELARRSAPAGTRVVDVATVAALEAALARAEGSSCVVLDAAAPSVPLDRAIAALTDGVSRVLLWRLDGEARERLMGGVPNARRWLALDGEVTAAEVVQLLGA
ncbi:MAG TPA: hypothetical protein VIL20_29760 [Sandaracinaceae bacterium]